MTYNITWIAIGYAASNQTIITGKNIREVIDKFENTLMYGLTLKDLTILEIRIIQ